MRLASFVLGLAFSAAALAQPAPVKIGMSMPQTGSLGAGGKAALLALLMGNFSFQVNHTVKHDMWFNNSPWTDASSWSDGFIHIGQKAGAKTIAFLAADQEFAQNLANGARTLAKKAGLQTVYDQNYPPATVDFSAMIRAIRAARPDIVFVMSYPNDSVAIVRAINEIGVGDSVKLFGGGMVGLQFTPNMVSLGSSLNGIVNYNSYVPGVKYPGIEDFLQRYAKRAVEAKVDPLDRKSDG